MWSSCILFISVGNIDVVKSEPVDNYDHELDSDDEESKNANTISNADDVSFFFNITCICILKNSND